MTIPMPAGYICFPVKIKIMKKEKPSGQFPFVANGYSIPQTKERQPEESFRRALEKRLGELIEVLIAAIGDECGEVGAVRQFEGQDRRA